MKLRPPSSSKIRAELITQQINNYSPTTKLKPFVIVATGRTGSGKSTTGNLSVGEEAFLETSGHQDCTKEINSIEFKNGFVYVDLPGIASDDKLENYNRFAFGINQIEQFPQVDKVTLAQYRKDEPVQRTDYNSTQWKHRQLLNPENLILYFVAPQTQFLPAEAAYLKDLLKHNRQIKIIYVLNLFVDKNTKTEYLATPQNIDDAITQITKAHQEVLGKNSTPTIVKLNCLTGEGLHDLLESSLDKLGEEKGKLFKDLTLHQTEKTPQVYLEAVKRELIKESAFIACQKPENESDTAILSTATKDIWEFFTQVLNISSPMPLSLEKLLKDKAAMVVSQSVERHYDKVIRQMSKPIYTPVARNKTVYDLVDDRDNPIWTTETIRHYCMGIHYKTTYNRYISGFHKKRVPREEFSHYENVYSHTESWQEDTGEKRLVGQTYHYFKEAGVSFFLTSCYVILSELISKGDEDLDQAQKYESLYKDINQKIATLSQFPPEPTQESVLALLESHLNSLFDSSFDELLLKNLI